MWFRKQTPRQIVECRGFHVGQLVQHKVGGGKAVICEFFEQNGVMFARVARGEFGFDECDCYVSEIEPYCAEPASGGTEAR